jgi:hypothetical protein
VLVVLVASVSRSFPAPLMWMDTSRAWASPSRRAMWRSAVGTLGAKNSTATPPAATGAAKVMLNPAELDAASVSIPRAPWMAALES